MKARQAAKELGITFHVGSQTATPEAYVTALAEVGKLIAKAGVVLDRLDVGGGFPSVYDETSRRRSRTSCAPSTRASRSCRSASGAG